MKSKFLLLFVMALSLSATAQITITTQALKATDTITLSRATDASIAKLPAFKAGGSQTWDFSALAFTATPGSFKFAPQANANYPTATTTSPSIAVLGPISIPAIRYYEKSASGLKILGFSNVAIKSSLLTITGNAKDTLYIPAAAFKYTDTQYEYPIKYNDEFEDEWLIKRNYNLTVAAFGLNKTPGQVRTSFVSTKSVEAWGKIVLPDFKNKGKKVTYATLLQGTEKTSVDSVFLGGAPAPKPLMQAFGLVQGQEQTTLEINFVVPGFKEFAVNAEVDTNFKTTYLIVSHEAGFVGGALVGAKDAVEQIETNVFPNPSANGNFTLNFEKPSVKDWTVKIYDISGREINQNVVSGYGKINQNINIATGKGVYFYALFNENQQFVTNGILEVQ